ncbi:hypothetical protein N9564_01860 [Amylibacter sp.]|jgi:hypothetical protein|nr:hypothetical protein [Amylibacter sp.]
MVSPAVALLEILDKISFKKTLCVDITDDLKASLKLRSDIIVCVESDDIALTHDLSNEVFDLIISFADSKTTISQLARLCTTKDCEILIISSNLVSYALDSSRKTLLKRRPRWQLVGEVRRRYANFSIEEYYPFPDLQSPQMILSKAGLERLYFRYWSWLKPNRYLISKIFEIVIVGFFKSPRLSPYIILKLSKK